VKRLEDPIRFVEQRTAATPFALKALRYLFPDHWSFLLGEVALYAFIALVASGIYLTLFFEPSLGKTVYHGSYAPLRGREVSEAYASVLNISFEVKAGLLIRQMHHWAANVFIVAIALHLMRIVFTGAFRRPRELTYLIGLAMLILALLEGYAGYSLVDDLLSGMGLAIGYSVALAIPFIGANVAMGIWGAPFPGSDAFESRLFIAHVLLLPVAIGILLGAHLALVALRHHTQFRGTPRQTNRRLVGVPTFPGQAPRSLGLMLAVFATLFLLGGLVQINPVWLWGPYDISQGTNGAQPDWYLGWLIGGLRLMPGFDVTIGDATVIPNPFWGGVLFPGIVFTVLAAWPWLERRLTGDRSEHNVLDRPRDAPTRTALGMALITWVGLIFIAGAADRFTVAFGIPYTGQVWFFRVAVWVAPVVAFFVTRRVCRGLQHIERVEAEREAAEEESREVFVEESHA
jgi:ubiquinol-cytochrome c reductase cytochrome b subunit